MALTTRKIKNTGDAFVDPGGVALAGKKITFTLVNESKSPVDAWDTVTDERIAPIKKTATTDASGLFSVDLWPNDRGDKRTFYLCEVNVPGVQSFVASLPSGATDLQWIDFKANGSAISSDAYSTPLVLTAGNTLPVTGVIRDSQGEAIAAPGITDYALSFDITDSAGGTTNYPITITDELACTYEVDLSALVAGRYSAKMQIVNAALQTVTGQTFLIEVLA
jgi:hypothetical protein